ncbi:MAG: complex subunit conserved region [Rickettsiaceae bacterium]|jgi:hypothetical protein|nr:complex subunit conserved region [Rickettsiaceae bacterium]
MQVKIYQPTNNPMQSGTKKQNWLLDFVPEKNHKSIDKVMGWTSSDNTMRQLRIKFENLEDAVNYAKTQGWDYQVIQPQEAKIVKKSYADNFL